MLNTNVPMIFKSCLSYPRSTYLRDGQDDKVKGENVEVSTGPKWVAKNTVEDAESQLVHRDIVRVVITSGRLSFRKNQATVVAVS